MYYYELVKLLKEFINKFCDQIQNKTIIIECILNFFIIIIEKILI